VLSRRKLLFGSVEVELIQALGQALCGAAVVYEDDRGGVLADQLQ
jgi:hypothetical protein